MMGKGTENNLKNGVSKEESSRLHADFRKHLFLACLVEDYSIYRIVELISRLASIWDKIELKDVSIRLLHVNQHIINLRKQRLLHSITLVHPIPKQLYELLIKYFMRGCTEGRHEEIIAFARQILFEQFMSLGLLRNISVELTDKEICRIVSLAYKKCKKNQISHTDWLEEILEAVLKKYQLSAITDHLLGVSVPLPRDKIFKNSMILQVLDFFETGIGLPVEWTEETFIITTPENGQRGIGINAAEIVARVKQKYLDKYIKPQASAEITEAKPTTAAEIEVRDIHESTIPQPQINTNDHISAIKKKLTDDTYDDDLDATVLPNFTIMKKEVCEVTDVDIIYPLSEDDVDIITSTSQCSEAAQNNTQLENQPSGDNFIAANTINDSSENPTPDTDDLKDSGEKNSEKNKSPLPMEEVSEVRYNIKECQATNSGHLQLKTTDETIEEITSDSSSTTKEPLEEDQYEEEPINPMEVEKEQNKNQPVMQEDTDEESTEVREIASSKSKRKQKGKRNKLNEIERSVDINDDEQKAAVGLAMLDMTNNPSTYYDQDTRDDDWSFIATIPQSTPPTKTATHYNIAHIMENEETPEISENVQIEDERYDNDKAQTRRKRLSSHNTMKKDRPTKEGMNRTHSDEFITLDEPQNNELVSVAPTMLNKNKVLEEPPVLDDEQVSDGMGNHRMEVSSESNPASPTNECQQSSKEENGATGRPSEGPLISCPPQVSRVIIDEPVKGWNSIPPQQNEFDSTPLVVESLETPFGPLSTTETQDSDLDEVIQSYKPVADQTSFPRNIDDVGRYMTAHFLRQSTVITGSNMYPNAPTESEETEGIEGFSLSIMYTPSERQTNTFHSSRPLKETNKYSKNIIRSSSNSPEGPIGSHASPCRSDDLNDKFDTLRSSKTYNSPGKFTTDREDLIQNSRSCSSGSNSPVDVLISSHDSMDRSACPETVPSKNRSHKKSSRRRSDLY